MSRLDTIVTTSITFRWRGWMSEPSGLRRSRSAPLLMHRAHTVQGLPWHWHTGLYPLDETRPRLINYIENFPGAEGILVWDEPVRTEFHQIAEVASWIRENYPDLLVLWPHARFCCRQ